MRTVWTPLNGVYESYGTLCTQTDARSTLFPSRGAHTGHYGTGRRKSAYRSCCPRYWLRNLRDGCKGLSGVPHLTAHTSTSISTNSPWHSLLPVLANSPTSGPGPC